MAQQSNNMSSAERRNREMAAKLRHQTSSEESLPCFPEPRRINVARQDSLSKNIQNVLGPMSKIHNLIESDPNVWLGTSRNASLNKGGATATVNKDKEGAHAKSSGSSYNPSQRSKQYQSSRQPSSSTQSSSYSSQKSNASHLSSAKLNSDNLRLSSARSSSHSNSVAIPYHLNSSTSPGSDVKSTSQSTEKKEASSQLFCIDSAPSGVESTQKGLKLFSVNKDQTATLRSSSPVSSPPQNKSPNRERSQSLDMPVAMEDIFQEMRMNEEEPLSEIHTPRAYPTQEFNFSRESKGKDCVSDAQGDSNEMASEIAGNSDNDSDSDNDSEDDDDSYSDESDNESRSNKWNLMKFMSGPQSPSETEATPKDTNLSLKQQNKTENSALDCKQDSQSTQKSTTRGRLTDKNPQKTSLNRQSGDSNPPNSRSSVKGCNDEKKDAASAERSRSRNRPSSVSSLGSSSPSRYSVPGEQLHPTETGRKAKSNVHARSKDSSYNRNTSSALHSKSCSPLPRDSNQTRSVKDSKYPKRPSPQRDTPKYNNTVRRKEIESHLSLPSHENDVAPSVSNETVPSSQPPSCVHHRTGKKGPPLPLSGKPHIRIPEKKTKIPLSPARDVSSYSDSSSDEDEQRGLSSSSSSSSDSDEELTSNMHGIQLPKRDNTWERDTTQQSNNSTAAKSNAYKANVKRKAAAPMKSPNLPAYRHEISNKLRRSEDAQKKPRKQPTSGIANSQTFSNKQTTTPSQSNRVEKDQSKAKVSSHTIAVATAKKGRKHKSSSLQQSLQPIPQIKEPKKYPPLWVKIPTNFSPLLAVAELCNMKTPTQHLSRSEVDGKGKKLENDLLPSKSASKYDNTQATVSRSTGTTAGRQAEIPNDLLPSRRAEIVQVAIAASTSELSPKVPSPSLQKRKLPNITTSTYSTNPATNSQVSNHKAKRRKQETTSPTYSQGDSVSNAPPKQTKRDRRKEQSNNLSGNPRWHSSGDQSTSGKNQPSIASTDPQQKYPLYNEPQRTSSQSADITAGPADSSWPENETRIKTADQYMREGKRLKHEGDACADTHTGRTRAGESLTRALTYFEASLCFIMNGYKLELENSSDRSEGPVSPHSPSHMYLQTIDLLDYIKKMRPHDEQEEVAFKRLNISCLRSQALLYLRVYKLKKALAFKYGETIMETFKPKSNRTPSPWHVVNGQNVVSPVSPAVPSPYGGNLPGPSPIAGTNYACEQVSSSTQVNKIASPQSQNSIMITPKVAEMCKQFHNIAMNVMTAHEKWDQVEALLQDHKDFFRHVDVLTAHELKLDSSLRDLATYNTVILRQLRGSYKSPQE